MHNQANIISVHISGPDKNCRFDVLDKENFTTRKNCSSLQIYLPVRRPLYEFQSSVLTTQIRASVQGVMASTSAIGLQQWVSETQDEQDASGKSTPSLKGPPQQLLWTRVNLHISIPRRVLKAKWPAHTMQSLKNGSRTAPLS